MRRQEKRVGEPILGAPSFVGYSAALVRRLQVMAALLAAAYPAAYVVDDLLSGRAPNVARYMAALGSMLALALAARRFGPSRLVTIAFILTIYLGYALTLNLPNSRAVYIVLFLVAIPMFYFLGGARAGRLASLGFVALNVVIIAAGLSKSNPGPARRRSAISLCDALLRAFLDDGGGRGERATACEEPRAHLRRAFHR